MSRKKKILLVEADLPTCRAYQVLFESSGINVVCVLDGEEALVKTQKGGYDCILLDVTLPKLDGWEVLERIKNRDSAKHMPVVIFTTLDSAHYKQKAKKLKADGFVNTFSPDQVLAEVESVLRGGVSKGNLH